MLLKFEAKSNRVKCVVFHSRLPWILVGLHSGSIHLWDYKRGCILHRYEDHAGPVRSVNFHINQPLFCSGGDDNEVRVWCLNKKLKLFNLSGHLDYVRCVEFHKEYPWILSTSDDQTVRIWNWQSRQCLCVLAGHHNFVMCARFHPTYDLIASASMDQTIRLWDISGLKEKNVARLHSFNTQTAHESLHLQDAVCKYAIEGHTRGVNWIDFHPSVNMIASASDDRSVKLWRFDESRYWEVTTFKGHFNNVSCVKFHSLADVIISNSEDKTIRIWDVSSQQLIHSMRRENDRFWALDCQQNANVIGVGHDSGMMVFKLQRERPASVNWIDASNGCNVVVVDKTALKVLNDESESIISHTVIRRPSDAFNGCAHSLIRNTLNNGETLLIVTYPTTTLGLLSYDVISIEGSLRGLSTAQLTNSKIVASGECTSIQFCGRYKYITLNKNGEAELHSLTGDVSAKPFDFPEDVNNADKLFFGGNNRVIVRSQDSLFLVEVTSRKLLSRIDLAMTGALGVKGRVRQCYWDSGNQKAAFMSKKYLCIVTKELKHVYSLHEAVRLKSCVWDGHGGLVYSTSSHLKYLLCNGDSGVLCALSDGSGSTYLQAVFDTKDDTKSKVVYLNHRKQYQTLEVDFREQRLKLAAMEGNVADMASLLRNSRLPGKAWIGYLETRNLPQVAFHYVTDPLTKAHLAARSGHLDAALDSMECEKNPTAWNELGLAAVREGRVDIAVTAFQKARHYANLMLLFAVTGNTLKMAKLTEIAQMIGNNNVALQSTLYSGNLEQRIQLLRHHSPNIAYITAKMHGLTTIAAEIKSTISPEILARLDEYCQLKSKNSLLAPPVAISVDQATAPWPQSERSEESSCFTDLLKDDQKVKKVKSIAEDESDQNGMAAASGWGSADDWTYGNDDKSEETSNNAMESALSSAADPRNVISIVNKVKQSTIGSLVACGEFRRAKEILETNLGMLNFAQLAPMWRQQFIAAQASMPGAYQMGHIPYLILKSSGGVIRSDCEVHEFYTPELYSQTFQRGIAYFNGRRLNECKEMMERCLKQYLLLDNKEAFKHKQLMCANYVLAVNLLLLRDSNPDDPIDNLKLTVLPLVCELKPNHRLILYKQACKVAMMCENYSTCADLIRLLAREGLEQQAPELVLDVNRLKNKLLTEAEAHGTNKYDIGIDLTKPMKICVNSLKLNCADYVECPNCGSNTSTTLLPTFCSICQVVKLG